MIYRFTLSNTIEGSHVITDPDGWKEIKLKLSRDKEYHSLIEGVELPLIFYRTSDLVDGGYDYIINVETTQGIDAQIGILIEVSDDEGDTYETFFEGLLLLETIKDISDAEFYKLECNIARTSLWSKFFSRKSQDVNLNASVDLDGNARTPILDNSIYMPSQAMRLIFERSTNYNDGNEGLFSVGQGSGVLTYLIFDNSRYVVDEVKNRFEYGSQVSTTLPTDVSKYIYKVLYAGSYRFQLSIRYSLIFGASRNCDIKWYYVLRQSGTLSSPVQIGATQSGVAVTSIVENTPKTLDLTVTLQPEDEFYLYGEVTLNTTTTITYFPDYDSDPAAPFVPVYTSFEVTADTVYTSTISDGFLLRDSAESILSKIVGRENVLYSDYLGDTGSGCASNYAIMKGLHVRGYSMSDKPMTMSFEDWWRGANPIFNLGLTYEEVAGTEYIRIEDKGYFYDETPSLTLDYVGGITRTYDKDRIFKSIEIGYEKWSAESLSGVDDPQTKHTYNTRFKIVGKDEKVLSSFVAASLAIEQTRRNRVEQGKDWRLDEDIIIVALTADSSPFITETDEEFTGIINLLNSSTRYNIRITPARNFERWKAFFNGCLQVYVGEFFKFGSGEGNIQTQTTGIGACDSGTLAENQDITVTSDHYHLHQQYEFEDDLTWDDYKTIRNARTKAILVSNTNADHKTFFIDELEYDRFNSKAKFTGWIKEESDWILHTGIWDDDLFWRDTETWID